MPFSITMPDGGVIDNVQETFDVSKKANLELLLSRYTAYRQKDTAGNDSSITTDAESKLTNPFELNTGDSAVKISDEEKKAYVDKIHAAAEQYGVPGHLLEGMATAESNWHKEIISGEWKSRVGATGLFQFMPATAKEYGVDPTDPESSIDGAARYLKWLLKQTNGNERAAVAAYNWGIGNVRKHGLSKAPEETRNYLAKIFRGRREDNK